MKAGLSKKLFEFVETLWQLKKILDPCLYMYRKNNLLTNLVENLGYKTRKSNRKALYYTKKSSLNWLYKS